MNVLIQSKTVSPIFLALALLCLGLWHSAQAVNPPPDGLYPGANTAEGGSGALFSLTTGSNNTAIGSQALFSLTTGLQNTAVGAQALKNNTGDQNTAVGFQALVNNTDGHINTAIGWRALFKNTTGAGNTATGHDAIYSNTYGENNTGNGFEALANNTTGSNNTAIGTAALVSNIDASWNTAIGEFALDNNNGYFNTATGGNALESNTSGSDNTAIGYSALHFNTTGNSSTALGEGAGSNVTTASQVICIGSGGANVDSTTWIGNIYGVTTQSGSTAPVIVSDSGQLGTVVSSERFKKDIATMNKASDVILSLRPVTFHYKTDAKGIPQFGLIAEEVAKVNPALVLPDKEGKPFTVRYDAVNAMLLNEFLKEHSKVEKLEATIAKQHKDFEAALADLKGQIQKVSAQLDVSKPALRTVKNDH